MKLIKPSYEIFEQGFEEQDIYKQIEKVGRTCYKSEDKITDESAKPFVDRMISSKHYAMLEHGTVYLFARWYQHAAGSPLSKYQDNKFSRFNTNDNGTYITTNLRVLVENNWLDDLQYMCEPTEYHEKRYTVKFICDRGVSHELVRHRAFSFAQESTRYCNYSKEKFGNELTFIIPVWLVDLKEGNYIVHGDDIYRDNEFELHPKNTCEESFCFASSLFVFEDLYKTFIDYEWKAQQARNLLPNALKTELVMTGFESDWKHFFDLRAYGVTGKPHPQASELAIPLLNEFIEKGYLHG